MSSQYGELRPTSGWDHFVSLGHSNKFQRVSRPGSVTARHSSSGRQPNFAALNRGHHLYSAGRPSRWALAHISSTGGCRPLRRFRLYAAFCCIIIRQICCNWCRLANALSCLRSFLFAPSLCPFSSFLPSPVPSIPYSHLPVKDGNTNASALYRVGGWPENAHFSIYQRCTTHA